MEVKSCRVTISDIRFTTAPSASPTVGVFVCAAKKLISARCSRDKRSESKKSKKEFGWSALWITIQGTSIWRKKLCNRSTTLLAQKCYLCSRYVLPCVRSGPFELWRRGWDSNPRLSFPNTRFPSVLLKPLGHLSVIIAIRLAYSQSGPSCFCVASRHIQKEFSTAAAAIRKP
jgi:hypothetical protein